jgi:hypothetical protein
MSSGFPRELSRNTGCFQPFQGSAQDYHSVGLSSKVFEVVRPESSVPMLYGMCKLIPMQYSSIGGTHAI